jgi:hypothetical protein
VTQPVVSCSECGDELKLGELWADPIPISSVRSPGQLDPAV